MAKASDRGISIASMTGYAAREGDSAGVRWAWELRSVNGRGLDLRLRLPDGLGALEAPLRKRLSSGLTRGAVNLTLRVMTDSGVPGTSLDADILSQTLLHLGQIRAAAEAQGLELAPDRAVDILALKGVVDAGQGGNLPTVETLLADFEPLLQAVCEMRHAEGRALSGILMTQIDRIADLTMQAAAAAETRAEAQAERLRAAVKVVLDDADIDDTRLAQEIAQLAVKTDVTEEIDRLQAHITAARGLLASGGPVGRKLDFLMQEFNREANTLCSKSQDAALTAIGLDLKLAIDQTREQVQNVE